MSAIVDVVAREILDSRGNPTVADGYCGELQYSREYYENLDK